MGKVVITYKDRLIRVDFDLVQYLSAKFGTEIVVITTFPTLWLTIQSSIPKNPFPFLNNIPGSMPE